MTFLIAGVADIHLITFGPFAETNSTITNFSRKLESKKLTNTKVGTKFFSSIVETFIDGLSKALLMGSLWIRTQILWCPKRRLSQLCHNHSCTTAESYFYKHLYTREEI